MTNRMHMEITGRRMGQMALRQLVAAAIVFMMLFMDIPVSHAEVGGLCNGDVDNFNHSYTLTDDDADNIATVAEMQVGKTGAELGYTYYWCAGFVTDVSRLACTTLAVPYQSYYTCVVTNLYSKLIAAGATPVSTAQRGDIVFFGSSTSNLSHVEIAINSTQTVGGDLNGSGSNSWLNAKVLRATIYGRDWSNVYILRPKYNQHHRVTVEPGVYVIHSAWDDNYVLDIEGDSMDNDANIQLYTRLNNEVQKFQVVGMDHCFSCIKSVYNGRWLDVKRPIADRSNVKLYDSNSFDEDYWYFEDAGNGYVYIANKTGYYLDVQGDSAVNNANIQLYHFVGNKSQKWRLERVDVTPAPTVSVTATDCLHSVGLSWNATTNTQSYSIRLYDASGNRIYLRDGYSQTAFTAMLDPGSYYAEVCSVNGNTVSASQRVPFTVASASYSGSPNWVDWRIAEGKLFRLSSNTGTWLTCKAMAASLGGRLAVVDTQAKQNAIFEMVNAYPDRCVFLGAQSYTNYYWRWENYTNVSASYTNWPAGKPDNYGGTESVLMMYASNGAWEDVPVNSEYGFVAEFAPVSLNLVFYEDPWAYGADRIRENCSVSVTFSDNSIYYVDDFQLSYTEGTNAISVTVSWNGLTAQGQLPIGNNPPRFVEVQTENEGYYGYDISCIAIDEQGVSHFALATWHESQTFEEATWQIMDAEEDGSAVFHVDIADFDYVAGVNYYNSLIAYDNTSNNSEAYELTVFVPQMDLFEQRNEDLTMTLPAALTTIEEGAFQNVAAQYFVLSPNVTTIESNAFPAGSILYLYGANLENFSVDLFGTDTVLVEMGTEDRRITNLVDGTDVYYLLRNGVRPTAWGEWSDWSTKPVTADENTQVETRTEYRTRGISYVTGYTDWSAWSSWSLTAQAIPDANLKQQRTQLVYPYYCFICPTCGWHSAYWGTGKCTNGHNISSNDFDINVYNITTPKSGCTVVGGKYRTVYNGEYWYYWDDGSDPDNQTVKTEYSYRTRTAYQEAVYTDWSEWSDTPAVATATLEVETRLLYHHRTKN